MNPQSLRGSAQLIFREETMGNLWDRECTRQERKLEDAIHKTYLGIVFIAALVEV